jgi:heptosyltransferase-1
MRLLLVKTSSMGDIVHNMPVVADLRRARPDLVIDWVVEEAYVDLVRLVKGVDRVVPVALRRWRRAAHRRVTHDERRAFAAALRAERYDAVLDTQGLLKSAWIGQRARLVHGGERIGFSFGLVREPLARLFYDRGYAVAPQLHAIERMRMLAAQAFGYADRDLGPPRFELDVPSQAFDWLGTPTRYAVLLHATARVDKAWPQERWVGLVRTLAAAGITPVLPSGNSAERAAAEALVADASVAALVAPPLTLPACAALLAGATAVVGVDTGLLHLAAALDVPTVGLFGATPRWRYAPYWSPRSINLGSFGELGAQPPLCEVEDALRRLQVLAPSAG